LVHQSLLSQYQIWWAWQSCSW